MALGSCARETGPGFTTVQNPTIFGRDPAPNSKGTAMQVRARFFKKNADSI
jgi:hypothetical protein